MNTEQKQRQESSPHHLINTVPFEQIIRQRIIESQEESFKKLKKQIRQEVRRIERDM